MSFIIKVQVQLHAVYAAKGVHAPPTNTVTFQTVHAFCWLRSICYRWYCSGERASISVSLTFICQFLQRREKAVFGVTKSKKWRPKARWVLLCFQNIRIDICFSGDLCRKRLLYPRKTILFHFWQNLKQFDSAVCIIFLFIFRDKKRVSPKSGEKFGKCQVVFFSIISELEKVRVSNFCKSECQLVVNFSLILRPFLLERRKLPLCEMQLILWLDKNFATSDNNIGVDSQEKMQTNASLVCFGYQRKSVLQLKCSAQYHRDSIKMFEKKDNARGMFQLYLSSKFQQSLLW